MFTSEKTKKILLLVSFICLGVCAAFAQGPGFDDDVEDTPIDGGVTLIAAVAAGYGIKKLKDSRNKQK